jgi:hypothetical protein
MMKNNLNFSEDIELLCSKKGMSYLDAVIFWCESNNFDVEYAASLIRKDTVMKTKIYAEAESSNNLKKVSK